MTHSIIDILQLSGKGVISLVGAGGKTTLMFELAKALSKARKKVLTTTTTKIFMPENSRSPITIIEKDFDRFIEKAASELNHFSHFSAGSQYDPLSNKIEGFTLETIYKLQHTELFDWIIVEADGARQKSLKASGPHEPVVPDNTTHLILVAGVDIVGKPLNDNYVHRPEIFSHNTGLEMKTVVDEHSIARSIIFEMKKTLLLCKPLSKIVFLNKADTAMEKLSGSKIAHYLHDDRYIETIINASLQNQTFKQLKP